ncbi:hypothetical protein B0H10DRAFT_2134097 [Mycena sp. CBHHK59/15]|nr:hypothetical protein B0H10DRAFT_2134097 [Mycena sp. CBHHK59/15]
MSIPLSAELSSFRTCAACYKPESKDVKFQRCGSCKKVLYCSKECQKTAWSGHKPMCNIQGTNRKAVRALRGTPPGQALQSIKKWFSKHTQLLIYVGTHAMHVYDRSHASLLRTHLLVVDLEPAPLSAHGEFVFKAVSVQPMTECLDAANCAALTARADQVDGENRHSLNMWIRCDNSVYMAPITVPRLSNVVQQRRCFGPPDGDWEGFLKRAVNKTLKQEDRSRI